VKFFHGLPSWVQGCLVGNLIGGFAFVAFLTLFTLTPLHLLFAAFAAWGSSGGGLFVALAFPAALLGAWVGGAFGIPIGALVGRTRTRPQHAVPGWLTGAIVTAYNFLPTFIAPNVRSASKPVAIRVLAFMIIVGLGALIGLGLGWIRRKARRRA
jgi:hypothetical protein